jgi:ribosomal-protein-alanine N-acetyltransferase
VEVVPFTLVHGAEIESWRYEPPYDFYDPAADPIAPQHWDKLRAVLDDDGRMIGYWWLAPIRDEVEVGLGLRPELTGRGLGRAFVEAELDYARAEWSPRTFRLYVAGWNARAIRVYQALGFREVARETRTFDLFGEHEFIEMERPA